MITQARIREDLQKNSGVDWITALRSSQIRKLVNQSYIQLSLFDEKDLAEITCEDYPGERLVACRNPFLAEERKRNREELLQATERKLDKIVSATSRKRCPLNVNNRIQSNIPGVNFDFDKVTEPTPVQRKALDLLGVSLICTH